MSSTSGFPAPPAPPSPPYGSSPGVDTWPRAAEFLTDTTLCPACFSAVAIAPRPTTIDGAAGPVCTACGLDLGVPEASALLDAGGAVILAESQRQDLLTRMRGAQIEQERHVAEARAAAAAAAAAGATPLYQPQASAPFQPQASAPLHPYPEQHAPVVPSYTPESAYPAGFATGYAASQPPYPPAARQPAGPVKPRRSGIQILMLTVGVILVSIMALFFVLLAYLVASLEVRSILTGAASVVVFGVSVLLLRRRLQGTAEGIAALAVVLFVLDLWIIRANSVFGSGMLDGWLYTGISAGVLTALLAIGARAFPLRTLSLAAVFIGPVAVFALVQGLLVDVDTWTRAWTALTAVGVASLAWTRISRPAERAIIRTGGVLATVAAAFCAFGAFGDLTAGPSIAFTVLAGVWFCALAVTPTQVAVTSSGTADAALPVPADSASPGRLNVWDALSAIGLGLTASGAGVSLALWGRLDDTALWLPAAVTAIAALVIAALSRIPVLRRMVPALRLAAVIPLGVAALAALPALVFSVATSAWGATTKPFSVGALAGPENPLMPMEIEHPLTLVLVAAIAFATLLTLGRARSWSWLPAAVGGLGLVGVSASIGQPVASVVCLGILAAGFLAGVALLPSVSLRVTSGVLFAVAVVVFGTIGLTSTATFPVTAIASVAVLAAARQVLLRTAAVPASVVLVPVATASAALALILTARMVPAWFESVTGSTTGASAPALWLTLSALVFVAAVPFTVAVVSRAESAGLTTVAALAAANGVLELFVLDTAVPLLGAVGASSIAGLVWQLRSRVAAWPERFVAAVVAPATFLWAVDIAWREFGPTLPTAANPADTAGVVLAATIVLLAALGPVLFRRGNGLAGTSAARYAWDGSLAVAAVVVLLSVSVSPALGWLTLVLLAVASLLVASGDGGIVSGTATRRHLAWLGLPLAVSGLWLGLARADATVVEFYTLPVAGLLLAILGVTLARRASTAVVEPGRTALFAAALAVGLLPSAVAATGAEPLRAAIVLVISAILIGATAVLPRLFHGLQVAGVVWLAGVSGATIIGLGRAFLTTGENGVPFEIWSAAGALLLLAAGLIWHTRRQHPGVLATAAVTASVVVVTLPTLVALLAPEIDAWRALLVLVVACGFVVAASVRDEFSPVLRWVSIACAVVLAAALLSSGVADPFEAATVPVAAALVVGGAVRLARDSRRGSWAELGPGLVVLLVPSLAANLGFGNELWRVVALGVVALLVLGAGLTLKLQAPTLIGAVVVVVHALAQLWPWISGLYGSVPWWLWAGIGGVVLIVLAATYESRIRDLKAVARGITSLR